MPEPFDNATKRLLREKPQHFVSWLVPEGIFRRNLSVELKSRNIYADGLFAITVQETEPMMTGSKGALLCLKTFLKSHGLIKRLSRRDCRKAVRKSVSSGYKSSIRLS